MIEINGLSDITLVSVFNSLGLTVALAICLIAMTINKYRNKDTSTDDLIALMFITLLITMVINLGLLIHL